MYLGLTGGIGAGKSILAKALNILGIPSYNTDEKARYVMENLPSMVRSIKDRFGENMYQADGSINREKLAAKLFGDAAARKALNDMVHPVVRKDFEEWAKNQNTEAVIYEAALLPKTVSYKRLDRIILVDAGENIRIRRVVERSGMSADAVEMRMKAQMNPKLAHKEADYIVSNDDAQAVFPQIITILDQLNISYG